MALLRGPNFIFEKANPQYMEVVGGRSLIGLSFLEALPELVDQPFHRLLERVFETGESYTASEAPVMLIRHPGGEPEKIFFDFSYSLVKDGDGRPYGIYIYALDISDKVLARTQIEMLAGQLQESLRARDEFLSIASHELKTPLTSLKLHTQIIKRGIEKGDKAVFSEEKVVLMVSQFEKQVNRLTRLIDDTLDISRIRTGNLTLEPEKINLRELVIESIDRMSGLFVAAGYGIPKLSIAADISGVWDRMRLEQVINNLFTNAIRYGKGLPVEVEIHSAPGMARLTVKDQGIGIANDMHEKIFDQFQRAVSANEVSGLGLGLFITKQIVMAHEGRIRVESELGKGSTFFVELPSAASDPVCG